MYYFSRPHRIWDSNMEDSTRTYWEFTVSFISANEGKEAKCIVLRRSPRFSLSAFVLEVGVMMSCCDQPLSSQKGCDSLANIYELPSFQLYQLYNMLDEVDL